MQCIYASVIIIGSWPPLTTTNAIFRPRNQGNWGCSMAAAVLQVANVPEKIEQIRLQGLCVTRSSGRIELS